MLLKAKSFKEYFEKADKFGADLKLVDKLICQHAPDLKPVLFPTAGGVSLGYGVVPYKTRSMKEASTWPLLALAAQKHYMALYACVIIEGEYLAEKYADKLGKVSVGKSCIRFKKFTDLDQASLEKMLEEINTRFQRGELLYGDW